MRLVDHEDVDRVAAERLQELRLGEPLGGDEDELALLLGGSPPGPRSPRAAVSVLLTWAASIPSSLELVDLVLHQGDEGRDDDGGARQLGARELVAERLAGAGGHDGQGVLPLEDRADHLFLPLPESAEAEGTPQGAAEVGNLDSHEMVLPFFGSAAGGPIQEERSNERAAGLGCDRPMLDGAAGEGLHFVPTFSSKEYG